MQDMLALLHIPPLNSDEIRALRGLGESPEQEEPNAGTAGLIDLAQAPMKSDGGKDHLVSTNAVKPSGFDSSLRVDVAVPVPAQTVASQSAGERNLAAFSPGATYERDPKDRAVDYSEPHMRSGRASRLDARTGEPTLRKNPTYIHSRLLKDGGQVEYGSQAQRDEVAVAAVRVAMEWERQQGRVPRDMNELHPNHPGFDIHSTAGDGTERHIEVKGLSAAWDGYAVELTATQFGTAWKDGRDAWLYVVEWATTNPTLHRIHNFAKRDSNRFVLDESWKIESEELVKAEPHCGMRISDKNKGIGVIRGVKGALSGTVWVGFIDVVWHDGSTTPNLPWDFNLIVREK
jgi:hypothetical protein